MSNLLTDNLINDVHKISVNEAQWMINNLPNIGVPTNQIQHAINHDFECY